MRILAGNLKGREIVQPKTSAVRPLGDKVRAALFDVLGDIDGLLVLDAYAGSGAAGFEAISRGAAAVEAIEKAQPVLRVIQQNAKALGLDVQYQLDTMSVEQWLANPRAALAAEFDLVIADPPYARLDTDILSRLGERLKLGGIMVVSHSSRLSVPELESVSLVKSRRFGDSTLSFYKR